MNCLFKVKQLFFVKPKTKQNKFVFSVYFEPSSYRVLVRFSVLKKLIKFTGHYIQINIKEVDP